MTLSRGRSKPTSFAQCRQKNGSRKSCRKQFGRKGLGKLLTPFDFIVDTQIDTFDKAGEAVGVGKVGTKLTAAPKILAKAPITAIKATGNVAGKIIKTSVLTSLKIPVGIAKGVVKVADVIVGKENVLNAAIVAGDVIGKGLATVGIATGQPELIAAGALLATGSTALKTTKDVSKQIKQLDRAVRTLKGDEAVPKVGESKFKGSRDAVLKVAADIKTFTDKGKTVEEAKKLIKIRDDLKAEKLRKKAIKEIQELEDELKEILKQEEERKEDAKIIGPRQPPKPKGPKRPGPSGAPIVSNVIDTAGIDLTEERKEDELKENTIADQGLENTSQREEPRPASKSVVPLSIPEEPEFKFSEVSNETIINGKDASRRKLDDAFKTNLIKKPKNFNNVKKLTDNQIDGATGSGGVAKQKAATLNNNPENIYNKIVREITSAEDCRTYLSENAAKIAILPLNLKQELRDYCESLMADDEESQNLP